MNLENFGVVELDSNDSKKIDGGWIAFIAGAIAMHIITEVIFNPDSHADAYNKGRACP